MNTQTNLLLRNLLESIKRAQDITVGLFKPKFSTSWELVIEKENDNVISISIGELFGLGSLHSDINSGKYIEFPDGKTLTQMMENPMEFHQWCQSNNI